jgi:predicted nuclease with RNAse H fold
LDVGADRIARTAYTAVNILSELRQITRKEINLVWNKDFNGIGVIEVYPAATLSCYSINNKNYKKPIQKEARIEIRKKLSKQLEISCDTKLIEENADALDSAICLLAAKDFLNGHVYYPGDIDIAQKEGWIWVRK